MIPDVVVDAVAVDCFPVSVCFPAFVIASETSAADVVSVAVVVVAEDVISVVDVMAAVPLHHNHVHLLRYSHRLHVQLRLRHHVPRLRYLHRHLVRHLLLHHVQDLHHLSVVTWVAHAVPDVSKVVDAVCSTDAFVEFSPVLVIASPTFVCLTVVADADLLPAVVVAMSHRLLAAEDVIQDAAEDVIQDAVAAADFVAALPTSAFSIVFAVVVLQVPVDATTVATHPARTRDAALVATTSRQHLFQDAIPVAVP